MGCMNMCGNESMNASESPSITHNQLNQPNFPFDQDHQNGDLINQIFLFLDQQNFVTENINSFENQMEDQNSTNFAQACYACSTILKTNMTCLQLSERCQL